MKSIEKGDVVRVDFNGAQFTLSHKVKVLYTPQATGDSWRFLDCDNGSSNGKLHYVSEGCTVTLLEKGNNKED